MAKKKYQSPGHRDDTVTVSFWLKKTTLDRWEAFCKKHGNKSRTNLIKDAVDEYIIKHETDDTLALQIAKTTAEKNEVLESLAGIRKEIAELKKENPNILTSDNQGLILEFLDEKAFTDKKLARLIPTISRDDILAILENLRNQGMVFTRTNKEHDVEYYTDKTPKEVETNVK
ncbi:MAG TPA: hypothetical protein VKM55_31000 [Candidatus Lokiarchaeia archaeon]|nr:hypothetical protein [Candidatus Lokiarchaeia archaeon]